METTIMTSRLKQKLMAKVRPTFKRKMRFKVMVTVTLDVYG